MLAFTNSVEELGAGLCELVATKNMFDALVTEAAMAANSAGVQHSQGLRTVAQYLAAHTNADPAPIARAVTLGKLLQDFTQFGDAYGELSESHLQHIRTKIDGPNSHMALLGDQELFVTTARDCSFKGFKKMCEVWLASVDPDGKEPQDQQAKTFLSTRQGRGGRVKIEAELDASTAKHFRPRSISKPRNCSKATPKPASNAARTNAAPPR